MVKINRLASKTSRIGDTEIKPDVCYFWPKEGYPRPTHIGIKNGKIGYFVSNKPGVYFKSYVKRLFIPIPDPENIIGVKLNSNEGHYDQRIHWISKKDISRKKIKNL